jgi:hypothetical protein
MLLGLSSPRLASVAEHYSLAGVAVAERCSLVDVAGAELTRLACLLEGLSFARLAGAARSELCSLAGAVRAELCSPGWG